MGLAEALAPALAGWGNDRNGVENVISAPDGDRQQSLHIGHWLRDIDYPL